MRQSGDWAQRSDLCRGTALSWNGVKHLPPWFAAIFGAVYLSGYLIEFFYYSSLGITDAASEVFKLKYVETGLTFLILLLIIVVPTIVLFGTLRANLDTPAVTKHTTIYLAPWPVSMTIINFLSIYCATLFAPLQYFNFNAHWGRWLALFGLAFLIMVFYVAVGIWIDYSLKQETEREIKNANSESLSDEQSKYLLSRRRFYSEADSTTQRIIE
jgi:hypothetical protein